MARRARALRHPSPPALELARDAPVPLYHQLATRLTDELVGGRFAAGDRYYTDASLVARTGLSLLTVRQAVGELVDAGWLERRHGSGSFVTARISELRSGDGVVLFTGWSLAALSGWDAMFFRDVYEGVMRAAHARGCAVAIDEHADDPARAIARAAPKRVVGVVGLLGDGVGERIAAFAASGLACATVNVAVAGVPSVQPDEAGGGVAIVERLVALGHRRIVHCGSGERTPHWRAVREAYLAVAARAGFAARVVDSPLGVGGSIDAGHACARLAWGKRPRPTALACGNDLMAIGALRFLREQGVAVPDDVSVTGYDDILAAQVCSPALTTVAVDRAALGAAAVDLLFADAAARASRTLPTRVVERDSTGPVRADPGG